MNRDPTSRWLRPHGGPQKMPKHAPSHPPATQCALVLFLHSNLTHVTTKPVLKSTDRETEKGRGYFQMFNSFT